MNIVSAASSTQPSASVQAASSSTVAAPTAAKPATTNAAANYGPAATVQLSNKALALIKGDKDWTPGTPIDSI
jgi:hypothetical protein